MPAIVPMEANEFIEQELDNRLSLVEEAFDAHGIGFICPLVPPIDGYLRDLMQRLSKRKPRKRRLVFIVTTHGGYSEVVQRIVETTRHFYSHVAFVVPNHAFSAGTILVMSGDEIHMDYYSRLGPIDPQVESTTSGKLVPALGYLIKWERLLKKAEKGTLTPIEAQLMFNGFDQAELFKYEQERELSISLLVDWLAKYKFKDWKTTETRGQKVTRAMRKARAKEVAEELNNPETWHSHGSGISMEILRRKLRLRIDDLDDIPDRCNGVSSYYGLLDDYQRKIGGEGTLHILGKHRSFR